MEDVNHRSLEKRVEELEKALRRVEHTLQTRAQGQALRTKTEADLIAGLEKKKGARSPLSESFSDGVSILVDRFRNTEGWIGKIGIGLLLFGLVFLFKYAVDQGWLTPFVRILFGLVLGLLLLADELGIMDWPMWASLATLWPVVLIAMGASLMLNGLHKERA